MMVSRTDGALYARMTLVYVEWQHGVWDSKQREIPREFVI